MGLINKGRYDMFFACGIWCLADISSLYFLYISTFIYIFLYTFYIVHIVGQVAVGVL